MNGPIHGSSTGLVFFPCKSRAIAPNVSSPYAMVVRFLPVGLSRGGEGLFSWGEHLRPRCDSKIQKLRTNPKVNPVRSDVFAEGEAGVTRRNNEDGVRCGDAHRDPVPAQVRAGHRLHG